MTEAEKTILTCNWLVNQIRNFSVVLSREDLRSNFILIWVFLEFLLSNVMKPEFLSVNIVFFFEPLKKKFNAIVKVNCFIFECPSGCAGIAMLHVFKLDPAV